MSRFARQFRRIIGLAKLKTQRGYRFIKELGGAVKRQSASVAAQWLVDHDLVRGRVLDFGCGHGFDADHFGWDGYDPYYRQVQLIGTYQTIICNHVLNMLTRESRLLALSRIGGLLADDGVAWLIVPRNIPTRGKIGLRKRIQNYVLLDLPSVFIDDKMEIYKMLPGIELSDGTAEIEQWLSKS